MWLWFANPCVWKLVSALRARLPEETPCLNCFFKDTSESPSRSLQVRGV